MRFVAERLEAPIMANMADGGRTPILSAAALAQIGHAGAIFPAMTGLAAAQASLQALVHLKESKASLSPDVPLFDFERFCDLTGFAEVWALGERSGRDGAAGGIG